MNVIGRAEFVYGKRHSVEKSARIVLVGCYALLVGNTVLGCIDKILCGTNYANNREYSYADKKISIPVLIRKTSVKSNRNALGNISAATARAARGANALFIDAG